MQIGMTAVHLGTADDPWCKKCKNRGQDEIETSLGKLSNRKSHETWELVPSGDAPPPPPPLAGLGLF